MWATIAAWAGGLCGTAGVVWASARGLLKRRSVVKQVSRLALVRACWRLTCLGIYRQAEAYFLRKFPDQENVAQRARQKFEKQIGLTPRRAKRADSPADVADSEDISTENQAKP
jgi:hypothetical protein